MATTSTVGHPREPRDRVAPDRGRGPWHPHNGTGLTPSPPTPTHQRHGRNQPSPPCRRATKPVVLQAGMDKEPKARRCAPPNVWEDRDTGPQDEVHGRLTGRVIDVLLCCGMLGLFHCQSIWRWVLRGATQFSTEESLVNISLSGLNHVPPPRV
ncbi:hypothetical protein DPEC_G00169140 [Dallia pectoralis]|uniref:Uncharacterized protein n=1 Tax=Dallia pectoralis TaxID=75939 RepID=A0ACC2GD21_DALPE|nr:hypothetical protein DPEC_G00169140 [Dallia pectoralis]